jgi:hypothetical protein
MGRTILLREAYQSVKLTNTSTYTREPVYIVYAFDRDGYSTGNDHGNYFLNHQCFPYQVITYIIKVYARQAAPNSGFEKHLIHLPKFHTYTISHL